MPVAFKAAWSVGEEDEVRFENADQRERKDVGDENCE
jgi:hypothetical protein